MKIVIVSNQIFEDGRLTNPILSRMRDSLLRDKRISEVDLIPVDYTIKGMRRIRASAKNTDLVHVHFGGVYALMVWFALVGVKCPKVITFHGTDIHAKAIKTAKTLFKKSKIRLNQYASFLSILLFDKCGFVSEEMRRYVPKFLKNELGKRAFIQSLGVDYGLFKPCSVDKAQSLLNINNGHYALFSDISESSIKRRDIAEAVIKEIGGGYILLNMCGVNPNLVPTYINASDFLILTSDEEGSPNIIRECLALNKPVFSVKVGDAERQLQGLNNSCIIEREPKKAAETIKRFIAKKYIDDTRSQLRSILDFDIINQSIISIYWSLCNNYGQTVL